MKKFVLMLIVVFAGATLSFATCAKCGKSPATAGEVIKKHPWLTDASFSSQISVYSPVLGKLVEAEQFSRLKSICMDSSVRNGLFSLEDIHSSTRTPIEWEMIEKAGTENYQVLSQPNDDPETLVIDGLHWTVLRKGKSVANGEVVSDFKVD